MRPPGRRAVEPQFRHAVEFGGGSGWSNIAGNVVLDVFAQIAGKLGHALDQRSMVVAPIVTEFFARHTRLTFQSCDHFDHCAAPFTMLLPERGSLRLV